MKIEFDPDKSAKNEKERGLPFARTAWLDWDHATYVPDRRRDYGEERFLAFVLLDGRLHVDCFSVRGDAYRFISFRKANKREEKSHAKATPDR